jgi:two-component system OmpR family sensor kinase
VTTSHELDAGPAYDFTVTELETSPPPEPAAPEPVARRRRSRWTYVPQTLAGRLVLGVVALVVLVLVIIGSITYISVHRFLTDRLDEQLTTTATGPLNRVFGNYGTTSSSFRSPQTVWAVALDPAGNVVNEPSGSAVTGMNLSASQRQDLAARTSQAPITLTTSDGVTLRVEVRAVPAVNLATGESETAVAVIGLSTDGIAKTLHELLLIELLVGGAAVLLAFGATAVGVRLSLRPLHRVTATARDVTAELSPEGAGLDRRVPVIDAQRDTEVGQVAESVNTLLGAVETQFAARVESERRMRQFMADASHELRTPLTSIRGYAELARMRRAQGPAAIGGHDDADALARIEAEGTRMSRLVDDLLTLARGDVGSPAEREPVVVEDVIGTAVDGVRAAHPSHPIEVLADPTLVVVGDYEQLLRVLRNLVTNAAVHTRPDGPIRVTATRVGGWAQVQVIDSGPGLTPEQVAHVFERFWRSDASRARTSGGSGLGLSIVASIVEAHGGAIRFDSAPETGSTVTVHLPLS